MKPRILWLAVLGAVAMPILWAGFTPARAQEGYVKTGLSTPFLCQVSGATAAAQCQAAPAAGTRLYVTDIVFANNAASAQTIKLVTGTGSNCGTGTADLTIPVQFGAAVGNFDKTWNIALRAPLASAVCVTPSAATSVSATITGYTAAVP